MRPSPPSAARSSGNVDRRSVLAHAERFVALDPLPGSYAVGDDFLRVQPLELSSQGSTVRWFPAPNIRTSFRRGSNSRLAVEIFADDGVVGRVDDRGGAGVDFSHAQALGRFPHDAQHAVNDAVLVPNR